MFGENFPDSKFNLHLTFFVLTLSSCFLIFKLLELLLDKNLQALT